MPVAFVYLLRCADDSLYCGWTTDIARRLAAHRLGTASRYTRSRLPVELALVIPVADRSAALREEARIKRLPRAAKLREICLSRMAEPNTDEVQEPGPQGWCVCGQKVTIADVRGVTLPNGKPGWEGHCPECGSPLFAVRRNAPDG